MAPRSGGGLRLPRLLSTTTLAAGASAADLELLQWNPHWQCFVWDQHNCREMAVQTLNSTLQEADIDFANIIEFPNDLVLPDRWAAVKSIRTCGPDSSDIVYNTVRWRPSSVNGSYASGCMVRRDRPFVVQQFDAVNGTNATVVGPVVVIGAHFPHPPIPDLVPISEDAADLLADALEAVLEATGVQKVVLIADTNEYRLTSSSRIMGYLRVPGGAAVSTTLERTCCYDVHFPWDMTFDRIMANFGEEMETKVLLDPLPSWAEQVNGSKAGAFHLPVRGRLFLHGIGSSRHHSTLVIVLFALLSVMLVVVSVSLLAWALLWRRNRRTGSWEDPCMSSSSSEGEEEGGEAESDSDGEAAHNGSSGPAHRPADGGARNLVAVA